MANRIQRSIQMNKVDKAFKCSFCAHGFVKNGASLKKHEAKHRAQLDAIQQQQQQQQQQHTSSN
jgi:transcription elongation factor Elf1